MDQNRGLPEFLDIRGDKYKITYNEDGKAVAECDRNKRGWKVKIRFTNDMERHKESLEAIKQFYLS
ncbi:hypothetical protein ACQCN2_16195 [Brevibacillus ginsengisoli]|uniref:hypothetical protein n=1 Tax=Brevibacillus ginsengisoli TaxID=363854 RepID=UPI003CFAA29C